MRLLITGGLGFIGSHLVDSLSKKNHDIMILTKTLSKKSNISTLNKKITIKKIDMIKRFKEHKQLVPSIKLKPLIKTMKKKVHNKTLDKS